MTEEQAFCETCNVEITDDNFAEAAWVDWLIYLCSDCYRKLMVLYVCDDCDTAAIGIEGVDFYKGKHHTACRRCADRNAAQYAIEHASPWRL